MDNESIEAKQEYLSEAILGANYDGEEFLNFLQTKKDGEVTDLNIWSLNELKDIVYEYKQLIDSKNKQRENQISTPLPINNFNDSVSTMYKINKF